MRFLPLLCFLAGCLPDPIDDVRRPCPDAPDWDPNRPLALRWGDHGTIDLNQHLARRISVTDSAGKAVEGLPFVFEGGLGLCVVGGLTPDADFTWKVTDGSEPEVQEWDHVDTRRSGEWAFHTAATSEVAAPASTADCVSLAKAKRYDTQCEQFLDSGKDEEGA